MAVSTIKMSGSIVERINIPITWTALNNPYFGIQKDIAKTGYKPIAIVGYTGYGTYSSMILYPQLWINQNTLWLAARMFQNQPVSLTENSVTVVVEYVPN